jgi:hypothetical protein
MVRQDLHQPTKPIARKRKCRAALERAPGKRRMTMTSLPETAGGCNSEACDSIIIELGRGDGYLPDMRR